VTERYCEKRGEISRPYLAWIGVFLMEHISDKIYRIARNLVAGASSFYNFGEGTNPQNIFKELVRRSQVESGTSYSGEIGMKSSFDIVSKPMDRKSAEVLAEKMIDKTDKYGPAFAIPVTSSEELKVIDIKVKVNAVDARVVRDAALDEVRKKWSQKGYSVSWKEKSSVVMLKPSKVKMRATKKNSPKLTPNFSINFSGNGVFSGSKGLKSYRDAVLEANKLLEEMAKDGKAIPTKLEVMLISQPELESEFVIESGSGGIYEVTGKVSLSKQSDNILGYLFFGFAPE
jgi:hypothetical protein